jgi:hypothetical protein
MSDGILSGKPSGLQSLKASAQLREAFSEKLSLEAALNVFTDLHFSNIIPIPYNLFAHGTPSDLFSPKTNIPHP